jgi:hypothetical protein
VLLIKFKPPTTKNKKIMPRSVVAKEQEEKKKMKQAKGFDVKRLDSC